MNFPKKFVCEDTEYSNYEKYVPAPLFRKSFILNSNVNTAEMLICGLGYYDLFVNGQKITKGYLAPYIANSDHYVYYDKYDLLPYLTNGENVIGVMLGDGFQNSKTFVWNFSNAVTNSAPQLALSCEIVCDNETISIAAEDFLCKKGPVLFNDTRSGVFYDARLEEKGWDKPNFDDSSWHKPLSGVKPRGVAKLCEAEPIKVYREISPISIAKGEIMPYTRSGQIENACKAIEIFETAPDYTGGYIYDFGENNAGIYRLKIKGSRGQKISIQCAEQLTEGKLNYNNINFYPDGFSQRDIYYLSGDGVEVFEPMFTYHGYRYIYISGITEEQATSELLTYLVQSSALEERGTFECSDEIANKIYEIGKRSDISNFFYFPTDCPHREKNGWTGDASASAEHMIMTIGAENSFREWLNNIRAAQKDTGEIPGIVPTYDWGYGWGNGPAWDSALFNLPYFIYKYRGDNEVICENAASMLRYLEYVSRKRNENGIIAFGLGDWLPVNKPSGQYDSDLGFTDSVMVLDMCRKAEEMYDTIGFTLHKEFAKQLGTEMLEAIRREYIDFDTFIVKKKCQTSQAMAIFYDVFTEDEKQRGFDVLMDIIKEDNNNFTSGFLGMRVLFHVLSEFGESELAYHMITKSDFPSYRYWVDKGETTFLEHFYEYEDMYWESKNHHLFGDIVNWFMSSVGGLKVENASRVIVNPSFIKTLDWCKTSHKLPNGEIAILWNRKDEKIELTVNCIGSVDYELKLKNKYTQISDNRYIVES